MRSTHGFEDYREVMRPLAAVAGLVIILVILWDAFETMVLPRRVARRLRLTYMYFAILGEAWWVVASRIRQPRRREQYLSIFGPLSLILLVATWAWGLVAGFAVLQWGLGSPFVTPEGTAGFGTDLYVSGTTFFTLGLGDVIPKTALARAVTMVEAGTGFMFLALIIGYLPVVYQAFSRREMLISTLDEWAGSPPSAGTLLARLGQWGDLAAVESFLAEWERWAAELLESHISYPILAGFRSQHDNQSWLSGLTTILDTCALVLAGVDGVPPRTAWLTFAMARHAAVDLCQVLNTPPLAPAHDRLPSTDLARLREVLATSGVSLRVGEDIDKKLRDLRGLYERYVNAISDDLLLPLPAWLPDPQVRDNWQKTKWD